MGNSNTICSNCNKEELISYYKCVNCKIYILCEIGFDEKNNIHKKQHLLTLCSSTIKMNKKLKFVKNSLHENEIHLNTKCDGCGMMPLIGLKYKCNECYDFDLCSRCYDKNLLKYNLTDPSVSTKMRFKVCIDKEAVENEIKELKRKLEEQKATIDYQSILIESLRKKLNNRDECDSVSIFEKEQLVQIANVILAKFATNKTTSKVDSMENRYSILNTNLKNSKIYSPDFNDYLNSSTISLLKNDE